MEFEITIARVRFDVSCDLDSIGEVEQTSVYLHGSDVELTDVLNEATLDRINEKANELAASRKEDDDAFHSEIDDH